MWKQKIVEVYCMISVTRNSLLELGSLRNGWKWKSFSFAFLRLVSFVLLSELNAGRILQYIPKGKLSRLRGWRKVAFLMGYYGKFLTPSLANKPGPHLIHHVSLFLPGTVLKRQGGGVFPVDAKLCCHSLRRSQMKVRHLRTSMH